MRCERSSARRVGVDVEDLACGTVGIQVCDCGGSGVCFVQEDECDVIRLEILLAIENNNSGLGLLSLGLHPWNVRKKGEGGGGGKKENGFSSNGEESSTVCHSTGTPVALVI